MIIYYGYLKSKQLIVESKVCETEVCIGELSLD